MKPRVLYGNAITAAAGFFLASAYLRQFDLGLFIALFIGTSLIIGSACVLNNYLDQDIDSKMERTKTRALVAGEIKGRNAVIFSLLLGIVGFLILYFWTNMLVVWIGLAGFVDYVWLYGALSKRLSIHGTLVGSISGAMPILAGYCAVMGKIDAGAIIAFAILFLWQMPEFYSISIYRRDEYKEAGVPVMSVVKGVKNTRTQIFWYTVAFVIATALLTVFGYTGYIYLIIMLALGLYWLRIAWQGFKAKDLNRWSRQMFHFSLIILLALSLMASIGPLLP